MKRDGYKMGTSTATNIPHEEEIESFKPKLIQRK